MSENTPEFKKSFLDPSVLATGTGSRGESDGSFIIGDGELQIVTPQVTHRGGPKDSAPPISIGNLSYQTSGEVTSIVDSSLGR